MAIRQVEHELDKAIPFLLARAGARLGNALTRALKPHGLSVTEWRVCACLQHAPGQTLSELALHASTDLSALSRIVDRLVARRLTARKRSVDDKRSVLISLTARGSLLTDELLPLTRHYEAVALSDFDSTEIRALRSMLARLYRNATKLL